MKKRDKFHARKSDAKNMENHPKWIPKGSQNPGKFVKINEKNYVEKRSKKRDNPGSPRKLPQVPGDTQIQQDS